MILLKFIFSKFLIPVNINHPTGVPLDFALEEGELDQVKFWLITANQHKCLPGMWIAIKLSSSRLS